MDQTSENLALFSGLITSAAVLAMLYYLAKAVFRRPRKTALSRAALSFCVAFVTPMIASLAGVLPKAAPTWDAAVKPTLHGARAVAAQQPKKETISTGSISNPDSDRFMVRLTNVSWRKTGFGTIMEASFTVDNRLSRTVKDIDVECHWYGPSGTVIGKSVETIYRRFPSGKTRVADFNMGFISSQTDTVGCRTARVPPA